VPELPGSFAHKVCLHLSIPESKNAISRPSPVCHAPAAAAQRHFPLYHVRHEILDTKYTYLSLEGVSGDRCSPAPLGRRDSCRPQVPLPRPPDCRRSPRCPFARRRCLRLGSGSCSTRSKESTYAIVTLRTHAQHTAAGCGGG
jgi:hypothetical protein